MVLVLVLDSLRDLLVLCRDSATGYSVVSVLSREKARDSSQSVCLGRREMADNRRDTGMESSPRLADRDTQLETSPFQLLACTQGTV